VNWAAQHVAANDKPTSTIQSVPTTRQTSSSRSPVVESGIEKLELDCSHNGDGDSGSDSDGASMNGEGDGMKPGAKGRPACSGDGAREYPAPDMRRCEDVSTSPEGNIDESNHSLVEPAGITSHSLGAPNRTSNNDNSMSSDYRSRRRSARLGRKLTLLYTKVDFEVSRTDEARRLRPRRQVTRSCRKR
jgi:hypothetical protein